MDQLRRGSTPPPKAKVVSKPKPEKPESPINSKKRRPDSKKSNKMVSKSSRVSSGSSEDEQSVIIIEASNAGSGATTPQRHLSKSSRKDVPVLEASVPSQVEEEEVEVEETVPQISGRSARSARSGKSSKRRRSRTSSSHSPESKREKEIHVELTPVAGSSSVRDTTGDVITKGKISNLIVDAIQKLAQPQGSSMQAIKGYLAKNHKVDIERHAKEIKGCLKQAVENGTLFIEDRKYKMTGVHEQKAATKKDPKARQQNKTPTRKDPKARQQKKTPTRKEPKARQQKKTPTRKDPKSRQQKKPPPSRKSTKGTTKKKASTPGKQKASSVPKKRGQSRK